MRVLYHWANVHEIREIHIRIKPTQSRMLPVMHFPLFVLAGNFFFLFKYILSLPLDITFYFRMIHAVTFLYSLD